MLVDKPIREAKARKEGWEEGLEEGRNQVRGEVSALLCNGNIFPKYPSVRCTD